MGIFQISVPMQNHIGQIYLISAANKLCSAKLKYTVVIKCPVKCSVNQFVIYYNHALALWNQITNQLVHTPYIIYIFFRLTSDMPKFACQFNFWIAVQIYVQKLHDPLNCHKYTILWVGGSTCTSLFFLFKAACHGLYSFNSS